jgi:hypothetical protein
VETVGGFEKVFPVSADEPGPVPTPARRLRDALEPIGTISWQSDVATAVVRAAGVDPAHAYVWGRSAPLGSDVPPALVISAFGVFEPEVITPILVAARSAVSREDLLAAREAGAVAALRAVDIPVGTADVDALGQCLLGGLTSIDGTARPLFTALRAQPVPTDPLGVLWRAAELAREHRGDGHLAACVAAGLDRVEMNVLTELWLGYPFGEYSGTRGASEERLCEAAAALGRRGWLDPGRTLTEAGARARGEIEQATDRSQDALVAALGEDLAWVTASAGAVGAAIVDAGAAPSDPRKRAAG